MSHELGERGHMLIVYRLLGELLPAHRCGKIGWIGFLQACPDLLDLGRCLCALLCRLSLGYFREPRLQITR